MRVGGAANDQTGTIALGNDTNPVGTYGDNGIFRGGIGSLGTGNYTNISSYQGIVFNVGNAAFGSQSTRMLIDVNGNVCVGTTTPVSNCRLTLQSSNTARFAITDGTTTANIWPTGGNLYISTETASDLILITNANERMRILSGGSVGIGTTSPIEKLHVLGNIHIQSEADSLGGGGLYLGISNSRNISIRQTSTNKNFAVDTYNDSESWQNRITILNSGGALLVGKTVGYGTGTAENNTLQLKSFLVFGSDNTGSASNRNWNISTNGSAAGNMDWTVGSTNTGWPNFAYRLQLTSSGSLNNTTGTYGTISDLRLKENISDARNYLDDLLKLRVVKYSLKEESSDFATKIGFIAQEVEQVFPNLVDQSDISYDGGDGIRSVKTSILIPMLLKSIQELSDIVKRQENRIKQLENK